MHPNFEVYIGERKREKKEEKKIDVRNDEKRS